MSSEPHTLQAEDPPAASAAADDVLSLRAAGDAAFRAAQAAMRDTTRLTRLLTILSEPAPLEILLDRLLSTLSELFAADIVVLLDPVGTGTFSPLAAVGLPDETIRGRFSEAEDSYVTAALRTRAPVLTTRAAADPKVDAVLQRLGVETAAWIPVIGGHTPRGVLILARCRPAAFAHADVSLLTAMAYRIALTLEQAQRRTQLEQIIQTSREITRHLDEAAVGSEAVARFSLLVKADAAALVMLDNARNFSCVAQVGLDPALAAVWVRLSEVLLDGPDLVNARPFSTTDLREAVHQFSLRVPDRCPARALLGAPLCRNDHIQGVLYAMRLTATPFSSDTLQLATLYAGQILAAWENARLYRAARDELSERKRAEQALRVSDARFRALIRGVSDVIAILAIDGTIGYANPAVEAAWGCPAEALSGQNVLDRVHPDDLGMMRDALSSAPTQPNATLTRLVRVRQSEGVWRHFEVILTNLLADPAISGIVATFHDVTERKNYEHELTTLAFRDPLTGLANRSYFKSQLREALIRVDAEGRSVALFFFDLDDFKIVNDSLGHECGDQVLRVVADRVRSCLRRDDTAARLGGDEFTLFVEGVTAVDQVMPLVHRLMATLRDPIRVEGRDLFIGSSMGIAVSIPHQDNTEDLLRKADLAMYHAKSTTKGCCAVFDAELNAVAMERLELETELRRALKHGELRVYYQPIVELESGHLHGAEALVRWQHPRRGLVPPARIIPIAEETGLITDLGQWVLEEACRQMSTWRRQHHDHLTLSVNLSARQFRHEEIVNDIDTALRDSDWPPLDLTLEITESNLVRDPVATLAQLRALKNLGVRLAIDDFGTGYSSLSYLKQFPVDVLKIDRSFVRGIEWDPRDTAIAQSVVALASALKLEVVAEGIETEQQAAKLRSLGCFYGQGYFFAEPLPADSFGDLLNKRRERAPSDQSPTGRKLRTV